MKRHLSTLLSVLLVAVMILAMVPASVFAAGESLDIIASTGTVSGETIKWESTNFTWTTAKGTGNPIRETDTDHFRAYQGSITTITAKNNKKFSQVVFTLTGTTYTDELEASKPSTATASVSGSTVTFTFATPVSTFDITATAQWRVKKVEVAFEGESLGGGAVTPPTYVSITEALAASTGTEIYTEGVITFIDGRNIYIYDGTAGINAYLSAADSTLAVGDKVKVSGTRGAYKGLEQLASATIVEKGTSNNAITYTTTTLAALAADTNKSLLLKPVKIENVKVSDISGTTVTVTDGTNSMPIFRCPELTGIDAGDTININKAVVSIFDNYQLRVNSASDIQFVSDGSVAAPTYVSITEARAANSGDIVYTEGVIIFIDGRNVYIYDGTAGINAYLPAADDTLAIGDKVKVKGTRGDFNGLEQLANASIEENSSSNNAITYNASTIAAILADTTGAIEATPVKLENVVLGEIKTDGNTAITDANGNTINIRLIPELSGIVEGNTVTINAIVSDYNGYQLRVVSASDITLVSGGNQGGGNQGGGNQGGNTQGGGSPVTGDATAAIAISAVVATIALAGVYFSKKRTLAD